MRVKKRTISGTFFGNTVKAIEFSVSIFNQVYVNVQKNFFFYIIPIKNGLFRIKFLRLVFREVQNGRTGCTFKFETGTKIKEFFKNIYHTLVNHVGDFEKTNFLYDLYIYDLYID